MSIKFKDILKNKPLREKVRARARNLRWRNGNPESLRTTHVEDEIYRKLKTGGKTWSEIQFDDSTHFMKVVNHYLKKYIGPDYHRECQAEAKQVIAKSDSIDSEMAPVLPAKDRSIASQLDLQQRVHRIRRVLERLKRQHPQWGQVAELHLLEDLSLEQISRVMGVKEQTVRNWWRRARNELRAAV